MTTEQQLHERQEPVRVAVMLMTMDMAPFDELFERGPRSTWMNHIPAEMPVVLYRGLPMSNARRQLSAVRERLRFLGRNRVNLSLAGGSSWLTRAVDAFMFFGFPPTTPLRKLVSFGLRAIARGLQTGQWAYGRFCVRALPDTSVDSRGVTVARVQSLSNMLDIQLATFERTLRTTDPDGFLVLTLSTYLVPERLLEWQNLAIESGIDFASMPSGYSRGRLLSGGCMYISRRGMTELLADEHKLSRGVLNDVAITEWLVRTGRSWSDLPVVAMSGEGASLEECVLCRDQQVFAIRCTSHDNRELELQRMAMLELHVSGHSGAHRVL